MLVNTDGGAEDALTVEGKVARAVLGLGKPLLEKRSISSEALQAYIGEYFELDESGPRHFRLTTEAGGLVVDMLNDERPATPLQYLGDHTFGWAEYPMDRFIFHMENGQARGFSV